MASNTAVIDMAVEPSEKPKPTVTAGSVPATSPSPGGSSHDKDEIQDDFIMPQPMPLFHRPTHHSMDLEDYFKGPRDINHHSKVPYFLRLHGSVLPKMIIPLLFIGGWATLITVIDQLVQSLSIDSVLLTVLGFVVGLALSFRSTTAYERYSEGRRYWSMLTLNARNLARLIWIHAQERHGESEEQGKADLLAKLGALQLLNAFAVALKHRLRFEPSLEYPDLQNLVANLDTLAGAADQTELQERKVSTLKAIGIYLGIPMAESNPRKLLKKTKHNLGNTPLEILSYLGAYVESTFQSKTLALPVHQTQAMTYLNNLADVLTGCERVVNTPLPVAYSISIAQITWVYVMALPFQLVSKLDYVAIPATIVAGYIILGLAQIGRELENPFGQDVNDLPLDSFCQELANDIDALTSRAPPLDHTKWMREAGAKIMWPLSQHEYRSWESHSVEYIRHALRVKARSRDVKQERMNTFIESDGLTSQA